MNSKQWIVLVIGLILLEMFFIKLDHNNGFLVYGKTAEIIGNPCTIIEDKLWEKYQNGEITEAKWFETQSKIDSLPLNEIDIRCAVGAEMYEPFIYLTIFGLIICIIMSYLEPKRKNNETPPKH